MNVIEARARVKKNQRQGELYRQRRGVCRRQLIGVCVAVFDGPYKDPIRDEEAAVTGARG